ncbi:hypothetical protein [Saccharothrix sp.]|uniref:hypothetical protein n=1 Tax=Saccharothrix sp. TaxID=1873460 RepID=UPI002810BDA0|nr:hypothetical protein [Saccharothrix sp.]
MDDSGSSSSDSSSSSGSSWSDSSSSSGSSWDSSSSFDRADSYFDQPGQVGGYESYPPPVPGQPHPYPGYQQPYYDNQHGRYHHGHPSHHSHHVHHSRHRFERGRGGRGSLAGAPGWVQAFVWIGVVLAFGGVAMFLAEVLSHAGSAMDRTGPFGVSDPYAVPGQRDTPDLGGAVVLFFAGFVLVFIGVLGQATSRRP